MIHSLSGGEIKEVENLIFVKVQINESQSKWFICEFPLVKVGDIAFYENLGGWIEQGKVIRVERNVSAQASPIPLRVAKRVLKIETDT